MTLPISRDFSAIDGTSTLPAITLNRIQDQIIRHESMLSGSGFRFYDEFLQSSTDSTIWSYSAGCVDDSANDGFGSAHLTVAAATTLDIHLSMKVPLKTRPFRQVWRARVVVDGGIFIGINDHTSLTHDAYGFSTVAGAWNIVRDTHGAVVTAVAVDTDYHLFEMSGDGSTFSYLIDGVPLYSFAYDNASLNLEGSAGNSKYPHIQYRNSSDIYADFCKFEVDR